MTGRLLLFLAETGFGWRSPLRNEFKTPTAIFPLTSMLQFFPLAIMLGLGIAASVRAAEPTLFTAHVPSAQNTGGAVVIVSPAHATPLARWFNDRGLAAFTLPPTATAADTALALRTLRARAADYTISPMRIAVLVLGLGRGRGADLAADVAYNFPPETRPALVGLVWGGRLRRRWRDQTPAHLPRSLFR